MITPADLKRAHKFCRDNSYRLELLGTAGGFVVSRKFNGQREYAVARNLKVEGVSTTSIRITHGFKTSDTRGWVEAQLIK